MLFYPVLWVLQSLLHRKLPFLVSFILKDSRQSRSDSGLHYILLIFPYHNVNVQYMPNIWTLLLIQCVNEIAGLQHNLRC